MFIEKSVIACNKHQIPSELEKIFGNKNLKGLHVYRESVAVCVRPLWGRIKRCHHLL